MLLVQPSLLITYLSDVYKVGTSNYVLVFFFEQCPVFRDGIRQSRRILDAPPFSMPCLPADGIANQRQPTGYNVPTL